MTKVFDSFPVFDTERFHLRPFTPEDAPDLLRLMGDPEVTRYLGRFPLASLEEAQQRIAFFQKQFDERSGFIWGLVPHGEEHIVGQCLLFHFEAAHFRAELGYGLIPAWWGKGAASEVARCIINFGFNTVHLHSIVAWIDPDNQGSRHVLRKQGFVQEAHFHEDFFDPVLQRFTDTAAFGLLQRNWRP
ncbi:MAG: GNAT family N-acetyltransferase [Anaerolineae bacterium]